MSNINLVTKNIFIHIPKTGGTSMSAVPWNKNSYYNYYGHFSILDMQEFGIDISKFYKWCFVRNPWDRAISGFDCEPPFKEKFGTFEAYVEEIYKHKAHYSQLNYRWKFTTEGIQGLTTQGPKIFVYSQTSFVTIDNKICMDFVGRFENLQEDWLKLCNILKEKRPYQIKKDIYFAKPEHFNLPHERRRKNYAQCKYTEKPYQEYYNNDTKRMIEEIYINDIINFNYKFD